MPVRWQLLLLGMGRQSYRDLRKVKLNYGMSLKSAVSTSFYVNLRRDSNQLAITRSFSLLYTLSLLTLLTRIQLNLLGRRNYLSSVVSLASPSPNESIISLENRDDDSIDPSYGNDFETNRKFLTFSWWLLHRGWRDIMEKVEMAVRETFGPLNPREDISLERLSALTLEVRRKVEGATPEERRYIRICISRTISKEFLLTSSVPAIGSHTSSLPATKKTSSSANLGCPPHPPTHLLKPSSSLNQAHPLLSAAF